MSKKHVIPAWDQNRWFLLNLSPEPTAGAEVEFQGQCFNSSYDLVESKPTKQSKIKFGNMFQKKLPFE